MKTILTCILVPCLLSAASSARSIWYVDADATGEENGDSWFHAFTDLQDALARAASGDEIWVAEGTYTPSDSDASLSFVLVDGVGLYGGFSGVESSRSERDPQMHETILSGDIGRDDVVGSGSGWYLGWNRNTANAGHVLTAEHVGSDTIVDGFIIADGATGPSGTIAGDTLMWGSGLYAVDSSLTVRDCTFRHNLCAWAKGGAIFLWDSNARITRCRLVENWAHLGDGAGLGTYGTSAPIVEECLFRDNHCTEASGGGNGAGMAHWASTDITVRRCEFRSNHASPFYAIGGNGAYGGGLWNWSGSMTVQDCTFQGNVANVGAGFWTWGDATVIDSLFFDNEARPQPRDPYPELGGYPAGAGNQSFGGSTLRVHNSTFTGNRGKKHTAIATLGDGTAEIVNSILWNNHATLADVQGTWRKELAGTFDASSSCIQFIFDPPEPGEDPIDPANIPGCIDLDPMFENPASFDLHLRPGSPCIDAGDNAVVTWGLDLDRNNRRIDDPDAPDVGFGTGPLVDMGAFERQVGGCAPDLTGDGVLDIFDIVAFLGRFESGDPAADWNGDTIHDIFDVLAYLDAFTSGC
ncbi:MAG: right-handed parallel beta-helix repeat-containing protein [Phycisphaerales bacterium]|nr:right-handed parallel beta-helix repeat-containing protein [Phycisphaerales bacterium]